MLKKNSHVFIGLCEKKPFPPPFVELENLKQLELISVKFVQTSCSPEEEECGLLEIS